MDSRHYLCNGSTTSIDMFHHIAVNYPTECSPKFGRFFLKHSVELTS
jgi:hypothetical protein